MNRHLTDLDEIAQRVLNFHSRNYLDEAIISYRAGAYRASLISTWIAVCVDIIEKIRELALSEDPAAVAIATKLDAIDPSNTTAMLAFERQILDFACDDLELISHIEKTHLERLKSDRNLCAHPTFSRDDTQFSPLAELALSYIVQAANYLLVQAPVKGKVAIEKIYGLIEASSFPEDEQKAYEVLSSDTNLGRVRDSVAKNLAIVLTKRLFQDEEGISPELLSRIAVALGTLSRMFPEIYNDVIDRKLNEILERATDIRLKRTLPFLTIRSEVWNRISNPVKIRLDILVKAMPIDETIKYRIPLLASQNYQIKEAFLESIHKIEEANLDNLLSSSASPALKELAITHFIESKSFASAEERGRKVLIPHSVYFSDDDLKSVFVGAYKNQNWNINQILNAGGIEDLFGQLYETTRACTTNHTELWLDFWNKAVSMGHMYQTLRTKLEEDGLLEPGPEKNDAVEEIPF